MAKRAKSNKRLYYKIGEACKQIDIQPYVLRYWETEFPALSPSKSRSGQRVYSERELAVIRRIKQLLYDEGYTIAGAKKKLDAELAGGGVEEGDATPTGAAKGSKNGKPEKPKTAPGVASGADRASEELDTRGVEEVQHLRAGIEKLLGEARELLALLDAEPS